MYTKRSFSRGGEIPVAMSRAFSADPQAAAGFSSMSSKRQQELIDGCLSAGSRKALSAYIGSIGDEDNNISYTDSSFFC